MRKRRAERATTLLQIRELTQQPRRASLPRRPKRGRSPGKVDGVRAIAAQRDLLLEKWLEFLAEKHPDVPPPIRRGPPSPVGRKSLPPGEVPPSIVDAIGATKANPPPEVPRPIPPRRSVTIETPDRGKGIATDREVAPEAAGRAAAKPHAVFDIPCPIARAPESEPPRPQRPKLGVSSPWVLSWSLPDDGSEAPPNRHRAAEPLPPVSEEEEEEFGSAPALNASEPASPPEAVRPTPSVDDIMRRYHETLFAEEEEGEVRGTVSALDATIPSDGSL
jgi:hypothetical protein